MSLATCIAKTARGLATALLLAGLVTLAVPSAFAQESPTGAGLPGGATSLNESHGDWTVACRVTPASEGKAAGKVCSLSQRQTNPQGQSVLAVELWPVDTQGAKSGISGVMVLPFGVAVRESVILKIDGAPAGKPLPFSTCLPAGCLVPLALSTDIVTALGRGKAATITAAALNAAPVELTLSLNGFAGALVRAAELQQSR